MMYEIKRLPEDFIVDEKPLLELCDGPYSYYFLEKTDQNTEQVMQDLAARFRIPRKMFSYAGSKDKRAVTSQYFSVKGNISDANQGYKIRFIGTGKTPISLGDHGGNHFTITVRNIAARPGMIRQTVNYFDDQRFGRNNLKIGLAILRRDFKQAAGLIDDPASMEHLKEYPNDHIGAIRKVPFKILNMFVHSVQSYIFNEAAASIVKAHRHFDVPYSQGIFLFPVSDVKNERLSLVSFDAVLSEAEEKILEQIGLKQRDFVLRELPGITPEGGQRDLVTYIDDLSISDLMEDELNSGKKKVRVEFSLGKGSYATIVIRNIFYKEI